MMLRDQLTSDASKLEKLAKRLRKLAENVNAAETLEQVENIRAEAAVLGLQLAELWVEHTDRHSGEGVNPKSRKGHP